LNGSLQQVKTPPLSWKAGSLLQSEQRAIRDIAGDAAGKDYWNSIWRELPPVERYQGQVYEQHPVLSRFLANAGG
jgi:hypothetical protein